MSGAHPAAEEWRSIPDYAGLYEVSSLGRVRSLYFTPPRVLSLSVSDKDGYTLVSLYKEGKRRNLVLHRLVCETFNGPPNPLHREVAHLDGSRTNAAATNLKWVSHVENHSHRQRHGTDPAGERHPSAKLSEADARAILASDEPHGQIAERFNVSPHTVSDIKRGKRWGHIQSHCAAFTPAPWTPHGNGWEVRAMDGQMKVCDIRGWGYLTGKGARALPDDEAVAIQKANENLIAAAPELYEALEAALAIHGEEYSWGKKARAAIRKARGEHND
jgi:hypothetical protein